MSPCGLATFLKSKIRFGKSWQKSQFLSTRIIKHGFKTWFKRLNGLKCDSNISKYDSNGSKYDLKHDSNGSKYNSNGLQNKI